MEDEMSEHVLNSIELEGNQQCKTGNQQCKNCKYIKISVDFGGGEGWSNSIENRCRNTNALKDMMSVFENLDDEQKAKLESGCGIFHVKFYGTSIHFYLTQLNNYRDKKTLNIEINPDYFNSCPYYYKKWWKVWL